jgi:hypothetical protein
MVRIGDPTVLIGSLRAARRNTMLTLEDCIALSDLSEEEIDAIAEHEHVPEIVATEIGNYLIRREDGTACLKRIILDDIEVAEARGDLEHASNLRNVLRHFIRTHADQLGKPAA